MRSLLAAAFLWVATGLPCFGVSPHATVVGKVVDADTGQVIPCTVSIQRSAPAAAGDNLDSAEQFYSLGQFEKDLPAGTVTVTVSRGFDYRAEQRRLDLQPGRKLEVTFRLRRQANLRRLGWYCGDSHVHMIHGPGKPPHAPDFADVALAARAAGLDYLSIAQDWNLPPSETTPARLTELCKNASAPDFILAWNMEAPKNYWRGDVTHCLGHGWFLGLRSDAPGGAEVIETLSQMSAHDYQSEKPPTPNFESHALIHALAGMVTYTHPCRWWWGTWGGQGIYPSETGKFVSNLAQELPYDTVVGPTYDAIDILMQPWDRDNYQDAQKLWFTLLNKGYRLAGTASTDTAFDNPDGAFPGAARIYTQVNGEPDVTSIAQAMKAGRNFVTNGPLLLFKIGDHSLGDVISIRQPAEFPVSLEAYPSGAVPAERLTRVELIRNGAVVKQFAAGNGDGKFTARFTIEEKGTAWYIARAFGSDDIQVAITDPIYFEGNDYQPPQATLAQVAGTVSDPISGKLLDGEYEVIRMVGRTPFTLSKHSFQGGHFTLEAPGTARVRVLVPGYQPMVKSVFMDYAPLLQMTLNLREAELTDWRTFEEIGRLLRSVKLDFPLARAN